jgi:hypothetical protein
VRAGIAGVGNSFWIGQRSTLSAGHSFMSSASARELALCGASLADVHSAGLRGTTLLFVRSMKDYLQRWLRVHLGVAVAHPLLPYNPGNRNAPDLDLGGAFSMRGCGRPLLPLPVQGRLFHLKKLRTGPFAAD